MPLKRGDRVLITLLSPDGKTVISQSVQAQVVLIVKKKVYVDFRHPRTGEWKLVKLLE